MPQDEGRTKMSSWRGVKAMIYDKDLVFGPSSAAKHQRIPHLIEGIVKSISLLVTKAAILLTRSGPHTVMTRTTDDVEVVCLLVGHINSRKATEVVPSGQ